MSLRAHWLAFRNKLLSDAGFQSWAARFPVTRPRARAEAADLFDLVAGFVHSQILFAFVELGLTAQLGGAPLTADTLAAACDLPPGAMRRLLRGAAALGLAEAIGDRWTLGPRGAALAGNAGVAAMVAHHRGFYSDLADPVTLLRRNGGSGELADYWAYARSIDPQAATPPDVAAYSALMAASQPMVAAQVIAAKPFAGVRRLLDIGGGEGAFVRAIAVAQPTLGLALFDLPAVAARARIALDAAGLARVATHSGSFFDGALPGGYDMMSLVRILHDHDDGPALDLLRHIRAALPVGCRLLIAEPMAGARADRVGDAYFGFYLLAMGQGRARRPDEIGKLLELAGFARYRTLPTPLPLVAQAIVATA